MAGIIVLHELYILEKSPAQGKNSSQDTHTMSLCVGGGGGGISFD